MSYNVPHRSSGGCLTCKQRKKKCDEIKPFCERCVDGGFRCLGYAHLNIGKAPPPIEHDNVATRPIAIPQLPPSIFRKSHSCPKPRPTYSTDICMSPQRQRERENIVALTQKNQQPTIPRGLQLDPATLNDVYSLIVSQHVRLATRAIFRTLPFSIGHSVTAEARRSEMRRWSLYLGAKITQTMFEGAGDEDYVSWIDHFHRQVRNVSTTLKTSTFELVMRLASLQDLAVYAFMLLNCRAGYKLFKETAPAFLQVVSKYPQLWSQHSSISIFYALHAPHYHIQKFVLWDTMASLAFGIAPLLHYDTALKVERIRSHHLMILEWVYGCPPMIVMLISKINAWRVAKWVDQVNTIPNSEEWREVEAHLRRWRPPVDHVGEAITRVMRLAIQEGWRQAVLIYLFMGMCGVNSADLRVELAVQQVVQLASTIEPGNSLENHFFMPCLIAGVAARQEKHRVIIRKKLRISRNENIWFLRGADFEPVLDHLWHGAGSGGSPTHWEDYVGSRCVILPIDL